MKTYIVRVEMQVDSIDLGEVQVQANSEEEAKKLAIKLVENGEIDVDWYASDASESSVNTNSIPDWEVHIKDN